MQSTAAFREQPIARVVGVILVVVLAAGAGLALGSAISGRDTPALNAGYPAGWQGGAAAPKVHTASAAFSLDAIDDVRAARGDAGAATAPAAAPDYPDYGIRHASPADDGDGRDARERLAKPTLR